MTSSSTSGAPARLGILLSESVEYFKAHWQSLLIGAVVFGVVMGLVNISLGAKAAQTVKMGMENMGLDAERMEELTERMEAGDEAAIAELEDMLEDSFGDLTDEQMAREVFAPSMAMVKSMLPTIGVSVLISLLLSFLAHAYYVLVAVEGKDANGTVNRYMKVGLPLVGVSIWSFLRSFLWIPFIGIIPGIILAPRFVAAPLIFLTEHKGITASVSDSYRRTTGHWAKIVGNFIVAVLLIIVASIVLNMVLGILFMSMPAFLIVANQIVGQLFMAFMTIFIVRLSQTLLQHPRS